MTHEELDVLIKTTADNLSRVINASCRQDIDKLAALMIKDHRTLVQQKMRLCIKFIELLNNEYAHGNFDARNEYSCKIAKRICDTIDPFERQIPLI